MLNKILHSRVTYEWEKDTRCALCEFVLCYIIKLPPAINRCKFYSLSMCTRTNTKIRWNYYPLFMCVLFLIAFMNIKKKLRHSSIFFSSPKFEFGIILIYHTWISWSDAQLWLRNDCIWLNWIKFSCMRCGRKKLNCFSRTFLKNISTKISLK